MLGPWYSTAIPISRESTLVPKENTEDTLEISFEISRPIPGREIREGILGTEERQAHR